MCVRRIFEETSTRLMFNSQLIYPLRVWHTKKAHAVRAHSNFVRSLIFYNPTLKPIRIS